MNGHKNCHKLILTVIIGLCLSSTAHSTVGDTGSYVSRQGSDGQKLIKAWIHLKKTGEHFLSILVDASGAIVSVCSESYLDPGGVLISPEGATDEVTTMAIELLKRKGHGRERTNFWKEKAGQVLEHEIEAGEFPPSCKNSQ